MMRSLILSAALLAACIAAPGSAADAPPAIALTTPTGPAPAAADDTRRLSPEAADAAIEAGAAEHAFDPDDLAIGTPSRGIHGEFGAAIGTGGARDVYGAATVPLGDSGSASVAFEQSRSPRVRGW